MATTSAPQTTSDTYALTVHDAAAYLGESVRAVRAMCRRRELDHLRTRGKLKFSRAGLRAWVDAHHVPATDTPRRARQTPPPSTLPMPAVRRFQ
jgi:excisionase family DNA binding protein